MRIDLNSNKSLVDSAIDKLSSFAFTFVKKTSEFAETVERLSHQIGDIAEQLESENQWWKQGTKPDIDGIYPERTLPEKFDNNGDSNFLAA